MDQEDDDQNLDFAAENNSGAKNNNLNLDDEEKKDIEISEDEAPDLEDAKAKIRQQNEKRRDKNRGVDIMGAEQDV